MADENVPSLVSCLESDQEENKSKRKTLNGQENQTSSPALNDSGASDEFQVKRTCSHSLMDLQSIGYKL